MILAANHLSHVDPVAVIAAARRTTYYLAKEGHFEKRFTRLVIGGRFDEGPHALDQSPLGIKGLQVEGPAGGDLEIGRSVLFDRYGSQEVLGAPGEHAAH